MEDAKLGMNATGTYEIRSGFCEDCGAECKGQPRQDGSRYCRRCLGFRHGVLKSSGTLEPKLEE